MAAENFKVKKGLEVGTAITATSSGVNVTGIVTATQFVGDGSGLTGVTGSGSGVVVKDEGSAVGTAGTINFVGSGVAATLSLGTATVTINSGGLSDVVADTTPQLGGNLDLNGKFINGTGGANITGVVTATTLKGNGDFVDIDVDGRADLDDLVVAGVSTFGNNITASGTSRFEIASMENGVLDGEISHTNDTDTKIRFPANDQFRIETGGSNRLSVTNTGVSIPQDLDVDGHTNLDNVSIAGVVTATSYYGDGSNLSNVISGVDLKFEGASVGTGVTMLNFVGFNTVTPPASGLSTITSGQNLTIGVRSGSAVEASLTGTSFNVIARSGGNIAINI